MIRMVQAPESRRDTATVNQLKRAFHRNRWLILIAPVLTLIAAFAFVNLATPVYDGVAALRLDKERSNLAVLDALQELSTGSEIMTEMVELRSRSLSEGVVDELDLNVQVTAPKRVPRQVLFAELSAGRDTREQRIELQRVSNTEFRSAAGETVRIGERVRIKGVTLMLRPQAARHELISMRVQPFALAVRDFRKTRQIARPDREANILEIRYESPDRFLAMQVPNAIAGAFIERRNLVRKTQAVSTVDFLNEQIDTLGGQITTFERSMRAFRESNRVISPEAEAESQIGQLAEMQAARDVADAERRALSTLIAEVDRGDASYRRLIGFPSLLQYPVASELLGSVTRLENERAELLRQRTPADSEVAILTGRVHELDAQLKSLVLTHVAGLNNRVANYDQILARFKGDLEQIPAKEIELARLRRQGKVTEEIYTALQKRLKEAEIAANVEDPSVRVVDPAVVPLKPIYPNKPLSIALAIVLGFALGFGIAFAREAFNTTIRSREELLEESGAIPILGLVPRIETPGRPRRRFGWAGSRVNGAGTRGASDWVTDGIGPVAEAYRTLRTNIAFTQHDVPAKVLVMTSALPAEGKSTSASNLARTLALQGYRVALIDADMRRGNLHESYNGRLSPGLSDVLAGRTELNAALQSVEAGGAQLQLLSTGTIPPNPAELVGSNRVASLLEQLRSAFDAVIIDSPPLNLVTDAAILATRADGVLLVARSGVTNRDAFRFAVDQLRGVRARILGCILNDIEDHRESYRGRAGSAYYGPRVPHS